MNRERHALVMKLQALRRDGATESNSDVKWIRRQIDALDKLLLMEEMERLQRDKRLSFQGETLESRLGADSWILN